MNRLLVMAFVLAAAVVLMANNPASAQEGTYTQGENLSKAYDAMDKNGDGKISKEEYMARYENRFKELDKNADGYLTKEEYQETAAEGKQKIQEGAAQRRENIKSKIIQRGQQSQ